MPDLEETTPETPLDAVIIVKRLNDDGTIATDVLTNGSVLATEVQTLIEMGLKAWRQKIGLVH